MEKEQINSALAKAKEISPKRNFKQSYDLIINLKGLDLKKQEHQIDIFITLPHSKGKKAKVCALVGAELAEQAKSVCDHVISSDDFERQRDKKQIKKLASEYDFFIAQADMMAKVATVFGRVLGPRGKMPNPKAGCVVPPNANLKPLYERLQRTIRVGNKNAPIIQSGIGAEDMSANDLAENALTIYTQVIHALPNEKNNIKDVCIKLTMGKPVRLEELEIAKETK